MIHIGAFPIPIRDMARNAGDFGLGRVTNRSGCAQALDYARQSRDHRDFGWACGSVKNDSASLDNQKRPAAVSGFQVITAGNCAKHIASPEARKNCLTRV